MKKIYFLVLVIFILKINVYALDISFESELGGYAGSTPCGSPFCATDVTGSGFRISLVDSNGTIVPGTLTKNFWPDSSYDTMTSGSYSCTNKKIWELKTGNNTTVNIGLPSDINSGNLAEKYYNYFYNTIKSYSTVIVDELKGSSTIDFFNAVNSEKYHFKFEPIYVVREMYQNDCIFYRGTTKEIINVWGDMCWDELPSTGHYSVGEGFVRGAGGICSIGGKWNATRNYIVGLYTPCKAGGTGIFASGSGKCFTGSVGGKSLSEFDGFDLNALNNHYISGNGLGVGYVKIKDTIIGRKITIYKHKAGGLSGSTPLIIGKDFKFGIYSDSSCSTLKAICEAYNSSTCTVSNLDPDVYYYMELQAPSGYELNSTCMSGDPIDLTSTDAVVNAFDEPQCVVEFDDFNDDGTAITMSERMLLYGKYKLRKLLDTSYTSGDTACKSLNYSINVDLGCLKTDSVKIKIGSNNYNLSIFNANNVSTFNTVLRSGGETIGYCLAYPEIEAKSGPSYSGKLGRMLIKADTTPDLGIATKVKIHKKCYVYKSGTPVNDFINFSNYVSSVSLKFAGGDGTVYEILSAYGDKQLTGGYVSGDISSGALYEYSTEISIPFKTVLSRVGTGTLKFNNTSVDASGNAIKPSGSSEYNFLGFGFATKYTETATSGTIPFTFIPNTDDGFSNVQVISNGTCDYTIAGDYPKFEYKSIDVNNPFPGKNYNPAMAITTRIVGSNWSSKAITGYGVGGGMFEVCKSTLTALGSGYKRLNDINEACDLNKDAFLDSKDLDILLYANGDYAVSNQGDNYLVKYIMEKTNDSNDSKSVGPKYEIELTSKDISVIRNYNKNHTYDNYYDDVECINDTRDCTSEFFESIKAGHTPSGDLLSYSLVVH